MARGAARSSDFFDHEFPPKRLLRLRTALSARCVPRASFGALRRRGAPKRSWASVQTTVRPTEGIGGPSTVHAGRATARCGTRDVRESTDDASPSSTAARSRPRRPGGHGRGASGQRPAELHARRPGRHRGQGSRASACAPRCRRAASSSRTTSASPSTWRRPTCRRNRAASTCRSRSASWPPPARSTPARLDALRVRRRAVARRRAAAGARRAGDGAGAARAPAQPARRWCCRRPSADEAALVGGLDVRGADAPARRRARAAAGRRAPMRAALPSRAR